MELYSEDQQGKMMNEVSPCSKRRSLGSTVALWLMVGYSLVQAVRYFILLGNGVFQPGSTEFLDAALTVIAETALCIAFFAILKWKKWGAYLLLITILSWVGTYTVIHNRSLVYFLAWSLPYITVASLTFIFSWRHLE